MIKVEVLPPAVLEPFARAIRRRARAGTPSAPAVRVVPYVAEQPSRGGALEQPPALAVQEVLRRSRSALIDVRIDSAERGLPDGHFWGSSMRAFLERVAPALPEVAVVVSHGNFLAAQLCGADLCPTPIPNGGVLLLTARGQMFFFIRHCLTCHNINKAGSAALTACHNFAALRPAQALVRALRLLYGDRLQVCSSPMPRSVLTAVALQREVTEEERRAFCYEFGACTVGIPGEEASRYAEKWSCARSALATSPFCIERRSESGFRCLRGQQP